MDKYINPFIDYGFKKLFATEANKDLLISFLNAVIDDTADPVVDLYYKNVEQMGEFNGTRANYFDVYCATKSGRQFIVEMQNSWKPYFKDRTIYYAAKPIRDQGLRELDAISKKGRKKKDTVKDSGNSDETDEEKKPKWNYKLDEVCVIAVMNFTFPKKEYGPDSYFHKVMFTDIDDHHIFYEKLSLYYIEMPKLDHLDLELATPREKWIYALYHLWRYDSYPEELTDEVFQKFYYEAEFANFNEDEQLEYERSMKVYLDTYNEIEGGRIIGREEGYQDGFKDGVEKGVEKGEKSEKLETARRMKADGVSDELIAKYTGLTPEEIGDL